ncbi:Acyl transferase/acyl hydrolase/lysophospholipase [Penicillium expansum]|uniref:Acyl transferase/acyl hydrolase/lysophospholipase n=1 Tax=Penicillium expansum TaxID=27334 RepID=A0A0A2K493_PENEN|nr:Acyl transferase/acyl hydrolase/lysophospholipase [Penicillium expansum]KGO61703.1 Acyl transferase/acyl hydrolase/lysophospholipase [Penicillium expansum]
MTNMNGGDSEGEPPGEQGTPQPIAIIGYACRLPGQVTSPSDLWELCTRARSGWTPIPKDRFSVEAFHHPNPSKVGSFNPKGGYFLDEDIARFDAPFFNLTVQEATSMDPQQRLLLECAYEALESAGIPKESLARRDVGVFAGSNFSDYELNNVRDIETIPMHQATGCAASLQSNRISYFFDLRGPSITVDTACSSSLVALHYAVQSLRSGESKEALVAGCHLNLVPDIWVSMSMSQLFNDEGKTFSFDERATSGFARGEGSGVVILKPLDAALRDKDPVRAVIVHSGVNQDGRTQGITLPNGQAQEELIRRVYREANINPDECGFVEMHGTGTKAGDPIEATAVHAALGNNRTPTNPLYIGSVKSNIGHLEGASGIIAIIKAAMMLDRDLMLPNAEFKKANPNIPMSEWNMKILTTTRPWPSRMKYLSVSNYGFGGTNAHAVLEKAPLTSKAPDGAVEDVDMDPKRKLFLISANDKESLRTRIKDFGIYFEQHPEVFEKTLFGNFAYTLGNKMSQLSYRVGVSATSLDDLGIRLAQLKINPSRVLGSPIVSFVFTGQGAQWAQMGVPLMHEYPVYESAIKRADQCLRDLGAEFSLIEELEKDVTISEIDYPYLSQPACTALQIALVNLLESWGIRPASVVGHSSGEISAAYAAGIYDLEGAIALAYWRGQMTSWLKSSFPSLKGAMIAVGTSREAIQPILKALSGYATVACVNSPSSVTVSGDVSAIDGLESVFQDKQLFNRKLKIDVAYHSDHMKKVAEAYLTAIQTIEHFPSATASFFSSVFGRLMEASELGPEYWISNLTSPVLFSDALGKIVSDDETRPNLLVEIGPHSTLKGPIMDNLKSLGSTVSKIAYTPTIIREVDAAKSVLDTAAAAYMRGATLNMTGVNFPKTSAANRWFLSNLPRYPWQHGTRYWHVARISQKHRMRDRARNDVLGVLANYSNDLEPTWRNIIRLDEIPYLRDHKMQGMVVYPMAGYLVMAIEAARRLAEQADIQISQFELREVIVGSALVLSDDTDAETTITLRPYAEGTRGSSDIWDEFRVCSWTSKRGWTEHCTGQVRVRSDPKQQAATISSPFETQTTHTKAQIARIQEAATHHLDMSHMYQVLSDLGAGYGPIFQDIDNCYSSPHHSFGDLHVRDTRSVMPKGFEPPLTVHPSFLDGLLHFAWPLLGQGLGRMDLDTLYMPTMIKRVTVGLNAPTTAGEYLKGYCSGSSSLPFPAPTKFNLFATPEGSTEPIITIDGLVMTPLRNPDMHREETRKLCYKIDWHPLTEVENAVEGDDQDRNSPAEYCGHTDTPGDANTNGNTEQKGNAHANGDHIKPNHDLFITHFGKADGIADKLRIALSDTSGRQVSIGTFGKMDFSQKYLVLLQTGASSLRYLTKDVFEELKKALFKAQTVLWVYRTDSPDAQMTVGLARTLRSETLARIATLGLAPVDIEYSEKPIQAAISALWPTDGKQRSKDLEFKAKGSELFVQRIVEDDAANSFVHNETHDMTISTQPFSQPGRRFKIQIGNPGALDSLYFVDDTPLPLSEDQIELRVKASGLNFKDIVVSMGQLAQSYIGIECSGVVSNVGSNVKNFKVGQRVMAMSEGCFSTYARCAATSAAEIPGDMSFEVAATVPVVFCTAYYSLFDLGQLKTGERVLIHAGAGGVGQAAIMLAQMIGADIFVTVGSLDKKQFLMTQYGIPEGRIFYSRDASFARSIRRATGDVGVDVIVNSLAGDLLRETWECLAAFGRFVEIGKADITKNTRLDMQPFEHNVTFSSVDLTKVGKFKPQLMKRLLCDVCRLITEGSVHPVLPLSIYRISDIEKAFRTLQIGKSMGKIVMVPHEGDQVKASSTTLPVISPTLLRPDASYILIGGTGGLGRSIAKWMSSKGAKNIVLVSRRATINERVQALIDTLAPLGVRMVVKACDVSSQESVEALVNEDMKDLPPIRGIIHGSMVLRDMLFENMSLEDFTAVARNKVEGAWNLHNTLINSPLDFFIALSSVAGIIGNRGQAAYSAANAFLDGFIEYRKSIGLPGTSIDLAAVSDIGYLADTDAQRRQEVLKNIGGQTIDESEVLALIAAALTGDLDKSCSGQCITGLGVDSLENNFWIQDARFSVLHEAARGTLGSSSQSDGPSVPLHVTLSAASSKEEALKVCYEALAAKLAQVLVLSLEDMDPSITVVSLGLDSLVAIEIRNWIAREANANVQVLELLSSGSLMALVEIILNKSQAYTRTE